MESKYGPPEVQKQRILQLLQNTHAKNTLTSRQIQEKLIKLSGFECISLMTVYRLLCQLEDEKKIKSYKSAYKDTLTGEILEMGRVTSFYYINNKTNGISKKNS